MCLPLSAPQFSDRAKADGKSGCHADQPHKAEHWQSAQRCFEILPADRPIEDRREEQDQRAQGDSAQASQHRAQNGPPPSWSGLSAMQSVDQKLDILIERVMAQEKRVSIQQWLDLFGERVFGWQLCIIEDERDDANARNQRLGDFHTNEIAGIFDPGLAAVRRSNPSAAHQDKADIRFAERRIQPVGEGLASGDVINIEKDRFYLRRGAEGISKPGRAVLAVIAPIADENVHLREPTPDCSGKAGPC